MTTTLIGLADIGALLRVTRQRARQLARRPDFPAPAAHTTAGHFWLPADITAWESTWDRTNKGGRPPKPETAAP